MSLELEALDTLENINNGTISLYKPQHTNPIITCANCGKAMESKGVAVCGDCIRLSVDVTANIQKTGTLVFCRKCGRLQVPPNQWIVAPPESRELLAAILKRIKGLYKSGGSAGGASGAGARLMDARFIWTEPHSRRLKLKITVQGEAPEYQNVLVQQSFEAEFVEQGSQCPDCAKSYTANTWVACIQVRQRVPHKRTLYYLEQLILKNKAHKHTVSISENKDGLDFFYNDRKHALKMVEFLQSSVPVKLTSSAEFISEDTHTAKKRYKYSYNVEIAPISKDDMIILPKSVANSLSFLPSRLVICKKITNSIHLLDPTTLKTAELPALHYWRKPFPALASPKSDATEFIVLDVENTGKSVGSLVQSDVTIARTSDFGVNDNTYYVRSHLGGILHSGDSVSGYDLENVNWNSELWDEIDKDKIQSVILIKKVLSEEEKSIKKKNRGRSWRLKRMAVEHNDREDMKAAEDLEGTKSNNKNDAALLRQERDYEEFLDELEEDDDLRGKVDIYINDEEGDEVDYDDVEDYFDEEDEQLPELDIEGLNLEESDQGEDDQEKPEVKKNTKDRRKEKKLKKKNLD